MRYLAFVLILAACEDSGTAIDEPCHFENGRPCPVGQACFGGQGNECNYYACVVDDDGERSLTGSAIGCFEDDSTFEDVAGGPFNCDPSNVEAGNAGITPPPGPCGLGGLYTTDTGFWGRCVDAARCLPIACDPAFGDEGCVTGYHCDAATETCQAD